MDQHARLATRPRSLAAAAVLLITYHVPAGAMQFFIEPGSSFEVSLTASCCAGTLPAQTDFREGTEIFNFSVFSGLTNGVSAFGSVGFGGVSNGFTILVQNSGTSGNLGGASLFAQTGPANGVFDFLNPTPYTFSINSTTEPAGTVFDINVDVSIGGSLSIDPGFAGSGEASAEWFVAASGQTLVDDQVLAFAGGPLGTPVNSPLSDSGSTSFQVADGGTFDIVFSYSALSSLGANGQNAAALLDHVITITATPVVIPLPAAVWLMLTGLAALGAVRRIA